MKSSLTKEENDRLRKCEEIYLEMIWCRYGTQTHPLVINKIMDIVLDLNNNKTNDKESKIDMAICDSENKPKCC